jgi:hypothetical protein
LHAFSNIELIKYAKECKIKHFRNVYMKDELPLKAYKNECGILNLDEFVIEK